MYGVFTGTSEAITERILGGLPGLSDVQVTSLATYAKACVSEGFQESFQGVMDAVYRASFMGEELPTTAEGWEEFGKDILKQGIYGAVTAGIMQSPALATSLYGKFQYNQIMNQNNISKADQKAAIKYLKDNDTTGKFEGMTNDKIKLQYGNEILAVALQNIKNQTQGYNNDVISSEHNNNIVGESEEIYDPNEWNEGDITEEIPIIAEIDQDETGEYDSAAWDDGDITEEIPIVAEIDQDETGEYDSSVKYEDNNSYNESVIDDNSEINSDKESSVLPINKINEGLGFFTNYDKDTRYFVNDVITGFNSLINLSLSDFNRFIESSFK